METNDPGPPGRSEIDKSSLGWRLFNFFNQRQRLSKWIIVAGIVAVLILGEIMYVMMGSAVTGK